MPDLSAFYQSPESYGFYIAFAYGGAAVIFGALSISIALHWRSLKKKCASLEGRI